MPKNKDFQKLRNLVENCKKCKLHKTRNKPVLDEGSLNAKIMLIGEAPGYNEDIQGRPFVGRAGKILDELLNFIDLKRSDVFIANILICRPPKNRNPLKSEIFMCKKYLNKLIKIINPVIIAPMGNFASSYIFKKYGLKIEIIGKIHGKEYQINKDSGIIRIIPLYHPAIAIYNVSKKNILFDDFKLIKKTFDQL